MHADYSYLSILMLNNSLHRGYEPISSRPSQSRNENNRYSFWRNTNVSNTSERLRTRVTTPQGRYSLSEITKLISDRQNHVVELKKEIAQKNREAEWAPYYRYVQKVQFVLCVTGITIGLELIAKNIYFASISGEDTV